MNKTTLARAQVLWPAPSHLELVLLLALAWACPLQAEPTVYDLAADWSTNQNPFGAWSLYKSETALFTTYQAGYGWADEPAGLNAHVPVWGRTAGETSVWVHGAELDRTGSDVTKARWTSPTNGLATVQGAVWMPADQGRRMGWQLRKNGVALSAGEVFSGDPYDQANPFRFELGSGGVAALTQPVLAGDFIELALISLSENGNLGESVGVNVRVELNLEGSAPPPPGLIAWWPGEGDARDVTGNHHGTLVGGTAFASALVGQGFVFDSDDDHVTVPHSDELNIGSNGFACALWVRGTKDQPGAGTEGQTVLVDKSHGFVDSAGWVIEAIPSDGHILASIGAGGPCCNFPVVASTIDVLDGQFHQVVLQWANGTETLFVDGRFQASAAVATPANNTRPLNFAYSWGNGTPRRFFRGTLDEVAVFNRALTTNEIVALFVAGSAGMSQPRCAPMPVGLTHWFAAEGDARDAQSAITGTLEYAATFAPGRVGQAFSLGASTDFVSFTNFPNLGTNSFSVAAWCKRTSDAEGVVLMKGQTAYGTPPNAGYGLYVASGELVFNVTDATGPAVLLSLPAPAPGLWHHVVGALDRPNRQLRLYLDGSLVRTTNYTALGSLDTNIRFAIGALDRRPGVVMISSFFQGQIDEVVFFDHPLTAEGVASLYAAGGTGMCPPSCTPSPSGLVGWWPAEGNANDLAQGDHGTLQNGATITNGVVGQAFKFSAATTDSVRVPNSPALNPTNITLAAWVKPFSYPALGCAIVRKEAGSAVQYLLQLGDGNTAGVPTINCGLNAPQPHGNTPVPLHQWSHIVGTYDGAQARVYVNGALVDSRPMTGPMPVMANDLFIGRRESNTTRNFDGLIDEVAIWNRGLSSNEVAALFAAGSLGMCAPHCTPPPSDLVAWWPGENNAMDRTGSHHGALQNGVAFTNGLTGQAFVFDGVNDHVQVPDEPSLRLTNALSIQFWARRVRFGVDIALEKGGDWTAGQCNYGVGLHQINNNMFYFYFNGGWRGTDGPADAAWHHYGVVARHGDANPQLYVDGTQRTVLHSGGAGTISLRDSTLPLHLGAQPGVHPNYGKLVLDEPAIWSRALAAQEIADLYAAGSAGMCPPACASPPAGLIAWWPGQSHANDVSGRGLHGTAFDGTAYAPGVVRDAFDFSGTNVGVRVANSPLLRPQTLSVAAWIKSDGPGDFAYIFSKSYSATRASYALYTTSGGQLGFYIERTGTAGIARSGLAPLTIWDGRFHFVVGTYDNTQVRLYVDGVEIGTGQTASGAPAYSSSFFNGDVFIGTYEPFSSGEHPFHGIVDEVCLWDRALSFGEIQSLYTARSAGLCPLVCTPPAPGLVNWWTGNGDAQDLAGDVSGALQGNATYAPGKVGQAFSLDGDGDWVRIPRSAPTGAHTIEAWVKGTASAWSGRGNGWNTILAFGSAAPTFGVRDDGQLNHWPAIQGGSVPLNQWAHVAYTWDLASSRLFIDGSLVASNNTAPPTSGTEMGLGWHGTDTPWFGLIDEVSIYDRALSEAEIAALVAAGSLGKCRATPPSCVSAPADLLAWWPLDGSFNDALRSLNGVAVGSPGFAAGVVQSSLQLDGQTQWASVPSSGILNGRSEATIEAWVRPQGRHGSLGNPGAVWFEGASAFGYTRFGLYVLNDGHVRVGGRDSESGAFQGVDSVAMIPTNVWTHLAGTWKAGEGLKIFVNGALNNTHTDAGLGAFTGSSAYAVAIGSSGMGPGTNTFNGGLDEVAVYGRALSPEEIAARYTAGSAGMCRSSVLSDFSASPEGWTVLELANPPAGDFTIATPPTAMTWQSSGGNPGGYVRASDSGNYAGYLSAPSQFLGNKASFYDGKLAFDLIVSLSGGTQGGAAVDVILAGAGQHLVASLGVQGNQPWRHYEIALREGTAWRKETLAGPAPTRADLLAVLSELTAIYIMADIYSGADVTSLDNFALTAPGAVDLPPAITRQPTNQIALVTRDVTFEMAAAGAAPLLYQWFFNTAPLALATNSSLTIASATTNHAGAYFVVVSNPFGAVTSQLAHLIVPPDLAVARLAAPANALAGQTVSLTWTVTNLGPNVLQQPSSLRLALATDSAGNGAVSLGTFRLTNALAVGASLTKTSAVILPNRVAGERWLVATADADNEVLEANEANNTLIAVAPLTLLAPDLEVSLLTSAATANFGDSITVTWIVTNRGGATASATWSDRLHLSSTSNSLAGAVSLATTAAGTNSPLAAGGVYSRIESVTLPLSAQSTPGSYFLLAAADHANGQPESDEANNLRSVSIALTLPPLPDLAVIDILTPGRGVPGQPLEVVWTVTNQGSADLTAPWTETASLSTDETIGSDQRIATFVFTNHLEAGAFLVRTQQVTLPTAVPGTLLHVVVALDTEDVLLEQSETNNVALDAQFLMVPSAIRLSLSAAEVREDAVNPALRGMVTRSGSVASNLVVSLASSNTAELRVPAAITIPAGQTVGWFDLTVVPDGIVDAAKDVIIAASALDTAGDLAVVRVLNTDLSRLTLTLHTNAVLEGLGIAATVSRDGPLTDSLVVSLEALGSTRLIVPPQVTIPAGTNSGTFLVLAGDDALVQAPAEQPFDAFAPGFARVSATVVVLDDDVPQVTLTLGSGTVSENAGPQATHATITRLPASARALTVELTSSEVTAAQLPARVTIPANESSISVPVAAVDDALLDGPQTTVLGGYVLTSGNNARVADITAQTLTVTDDEGPALQLIAAQKLLREGLPAATTVTVTRNTPPTNALTVTLASGNTNEVTMPGTIIIPLGESAASFSVATVADGVTDSNQSVRLTASAPGYVDGADTVVVSDVDLPDLFIGNVTVPASAESESYVTASYRVANQGFMPVATNFSTRVFLSKDALVGDDTLVSQYRFNGTLPPGQYFEQTLQVRIPQAVGEYWIVVQTDAEQAVTETLEDNNTRLSSAPIRVAAAYRAFVQTDIEQALAGTVIPLRGQATNSLGIGVPFKPVSIHLRVRNTERVIAAITDAAGQFAITWTPLPGEAGVYTVGADHPGLASAPVQDSFTLLGMKADVSAIQRRLPALSTITGEFTLENLSDVPLTGLSGVAPFMTTVEAQVAMPATLPAFGRATVFYSIRSLVDQDAAVAFDFLLTATEGPFLELPVRLSVEARRPRIVVTPSSLRLGLVRGEQRLVEFEVVNNGGAPSEALSLVTPAEPWLHVASTNPIPPLAPGETNRFTLQLLPPADMPIGELNGTMGVSGGDLFVSLPFHFKIVSAALGDVKLTAVDEFTYFGESHTNVAGAEIVLRDPFNGEVVARGQTDANGELLVTSLREGTYNLEASAPQHATRTDVVTVTPGQVTEKSVFLARQLVRYTWRVEEIEIEDRVNIVLETVFETVVPAPVITVEPSLIDLSTIVGNEAQVDLKISNHGLVAANDVTIGFGTHPNWTLTPLISDLGTLAARSSLTVPLMIRRTSSGGKASAKDSADDCSVPGHLDYKLICGPFGIAYKVPVWVTGASGHCGSGTSSGSRMPFAGDYPTGRGGGGGGGGGGSSGSVIVHSVTPNYAPTNECGCDEKNFTEVCFSGEGGFKMALGGVLLAAMNAPLPPYLRVRAVETSISGSTKICTCCEDGVQGLEAEVVGQLNTSITVGLGFQPEFETTTPDATLGDVTAKIAVFLGAEPTLSGSYSLTISTDCFFKNPKACIYGTLTGTLFVGAKGGVELSAQVGTPPNTIKWGGAAEAVGGVETGVSFKIGGCSDGTFGAQACFSGVVLKLEISGTIFAGAGDTNFDVSAYRKMTFGASRTLLEGSCYPPEAPAPVPFKLDLSPAQIAEALQVSFATNLSGASAQSQTAATAVSSRTKAANSSLASRPAGTRKTTYLALPPRPASEADRPAPAGWTRLKSGGDGICAQVRLQIEQEATFTRKAVGATLEVFNDSNTSPLEDLHVALTIYDEAGQMANDRFVILDPELSGIVLVDPGIPSTNELSVTRPRWLVPPASSGRARWVILPTDDAATNGITRYFVGGFMTYTAGAVPGSAILVPGPVNVYPNAKLRLKYFHQRDVFSDDPFTEIVEPAVPYSLAVLVQNIGHGRAGNFKITSAQPKIIDNEKGLLIDFSIIAAQVAGQNLTPSLTVNFGDLEPGDTKIGRWLLTSTLQGLFVDYSARFEHEDSLGGRATSLIDDVGIHEMIHLVQAGGAFEDGRPDFLVNDLADDRDLPDTLYLSDGSTNPVQVVEQATPDGAPSAGDLQVQLAAPMPAGWAYLRVSDPGQGQFRLSRVRRSDGVEIAFGTNVWTTDRTFIGLGHRPRNEHLLHMLDFNSPGTYTLTYEVPPAPDTTAPASSVAILPANSYAQVPLNWSGGDESNGSGLAFFDVFVSTDGAPFVPWLQRTTLRNAVFNAQLGSQYAFYTLATDQAGNREAAPTSPDTETVVSRTNAAPHLAISGPDTLNEGDTLALTSAADDADASAQVLTFSLGLDAPPGALIDPVTGAISWQTGEANGPSTNQFTVIVRDNGVPSLSATSIVTVVVRELNSAPTLAPAPDFTVSEGQIVTFTNRATDGDLPVQALTFSLAPGAPAGAGVQAGSGIFTWRPAEFQGGTTNRLAMIVTDSPGSGAGLSTTQSFTVIVRDTRPDFTLSVGTTNLLAGESSFVPLRLEAGTDLTNASFLLETDLGCLTNFALQNLASEVARTEFRPLDSNRFELRFESWPNATLEGQIQLAQLAFLALPTEHSAVVRLQSLDLTGRRATPPSLLSGGAFSGRVFVVAREPILDVSPATNGARWLTLYGHAGRRYALEAGPDLSGSGAWQVIQQIQLTGEHALLGPLPEPGAAAFYRVREVTGLPLNIQQQAGLVIVDWPAGCAECRLEETSALGPEAVWTPAAAQPVLHQGGYRVELPSNGPSRFYRLIKP
ncbi:MAG: hypothetical protein HZA90_17690 [Verrucomicrobia bacterium]|nr:hypothetical protein [Verrucomicrobiota bacterium]